MPDSCHLQARTKESYSFTLIFIQKIKFFFKQEKITQSWRARSKDKLKYFLILLSKYKVFLLHSSYPDYFPLHLFAFPLVLVLARHAVILLEHFIVFLFSRTFFEFESNLSWNFTF